MGWLGVNRDQSGPGKQKRKLVKVSGAKKVWGTLRATTALVAKNAISSIAKIPIDDMVVKRKYKLDSHTGNVSRWWFIFRGREDELEQLQAKQSSVSLQTAWKLEDVFSYAVASSDSMDSLSPAIYDPDLPSRAPEPLLSNTASQEESDGSSMITTQCKASDSDTMAPQCPPQLISDVSQCPAQSDNEPSSAALPSDSNEQSTSNSEGSGNVSDPSSQSPFLVMD